jgi:hypothetical protein
MCLTYMKLRTKQDHDVKSQITGCEQAGRYFQTCLIFASTTMSPKERRIPPKCLNQKNFDPSTHSLLASLALFITFFSYFPTWSLSHSWSPKNAHFSALPSLQGPFLGFLISNYPKSTTRLLLENRVTNWC